MGGRWPVARVREQAGSSAFHHLDLARLDT
jgi:hypothetical protein